MSAKSWKSFYRKKELRSVKENIVDTIILWCAIGMLWYAAVSMIQERFPFFIEAAIFSDTEGIPVIAGNFHLIQMEWGMIIPWLLVLWIGSDWLSVYLKKWSLLFKLAGIGIPVIYIAVNAEKVFAGFVAILQEYLLYWNNYYSTSFFVTSENNSYAPMAFSVLLMFLWWVIWNISYVVKKRVLLSLFPILLLILELIVGLSPQGAGLYALFLGTMLLLNFGGTKIGKKVAVFLGVACILVFCNYCFQDSISDLTTEEKKQEVLAWQESVLSVDFRKIFSMDIHFSKESVDNQTPLYTGEVVLEIESAIRPASTIYLKGFQGNTYTNRTWSSDNSEFTEICQNNGYSKTELAEILFRMPYDAAREYYEIIQGYVSENEYVIHHTGSAGNVAYAPYYAQYDSLDDGYSITDDFLLKKSVWENQLSVKAIQSNIDFDVLSELSGEEMVSKEVEILNEFANVYCVNEEKLAFFEEAIQEIKGNEEVKLVDSVAAKNIRNLSLAHRVKNYLSEHMSYSLILDDLPYGADPIEYAVMEGHEGYCMHFATAGTLLLRELGVPARYVSGYVVNPSVFDVVEDGYLAKVADLAAHAWVEIYLDNIGWVPFEMTPGYTYSDSLPTEGDIEAFEEESEKRREEMQESEMASETETMSETESEENVQETESEDKDSEEHANSEMENEKGESPDKENLGSGFSNGEIQDGMDSDLFSEDIVKMIVTILCFLVIVSGGYLGLRKWLMNYENALYLEMKRNLTRRAIKRMNRRLYHMLRFKQLNVNLKKEYWTDNQMEETLITNYDCVDKEDWKRYMDIVKKTHYSLEEISNEEMQHCYKCYKKVWSLTFFKQMLGKIKDK